MSSSSDGPLPTGDTEEITPEESVAFWALIEKLLLATRFPGGVSRRRYDVAISALCQGTALELPKRPDPRKRTKAGHCHKNDTRSQEKAALSKTEIKTGNSKSPLDVVLFDIEIVKCNDDEEKPSVDLYNSHSECTLRDNYIEYLPGTNVSDRLWRFVSKRRGKALKRAKIPSMHKNVTIHKGIENLKKSKSLKDETKNERYKETQRKSAETTKDKSLEKEKVQRFCHTTNAKDRSQFNLKTSQSTPSAKDKVNTMNIEAPNQTSIQITKDHYEDILKLKLSYGSQLESLNKAMVKNVSSKSSYNIETTKKYNEVKKEYLSLCSQESELRHQIAFLNAEIYLMQSRNYHKLPATIKTIRLDSDIAHIQNESDSQQHTYEGHREDCHRFSSFNKSRGNRRSAERRFCRNSEKHGFNDGGDKYGGNTERGGGVGIDHDLMTLPRREMSVHGCRSGKPCGMCSLYDLAPELPPPKRPPQHMMGTLQRSDSPKYHRLPKLKHVRPITTKEK